MVLHEFGEDFVLALELLFQGGDPAILVVAGTSGPGLECGGGVLEELLLPAIEHGGVDAVPITEVRDGGVLEEMKPKDGGLLLDGESFSSLLGHGRASARGCSLFEQTACPISTEAKHQYLVFIRAINRVRIQAGLSKISPFSVRLKRRIYRPFEPLNDDDDDTLKKGNG